MYSFKRVISLLAAGTVAASVFTSVAFADISINSGVSSSKKESMSIVDDEVSSVVTQRFPLSILQKVNDLINLGIVEGDPGGNLRLDDTLSRAEFAKISCLMLGLGANVSQESTFSDVESDHWASGYIATVGKCGIVNGYGDGTFRPDKNVSYSEAVKMIVSALGYTPMAEVRGGYPAGYITVANQQGFDIDLNKDVASDITRETAFDLVQYALDVPLMVQTGFGENVEYCVMDGKNDIAYITLRTQLLSTEEIIYTEMSSAATTQFVADNKDLIEDDIARYWKRMNYEGDYTYEVLNISQSENGTDVRLKVALFDENRSKYINLTLDYKYVYGHIK